MIHDEMLKNTAAWLNGETPNLTTHLIHSSEVITVDGTETSLDSELDRVAITGARVLTNDTFTGIRTGALASSDGDIINSVALVDSATGGTLHATATVSSLLHQTSFDIQTDWIIGVSRNT